jgi:tRNA pseudouridine55 synthase
MDKVLLIDKPAYMTSHDVVFLIKKKLENDLKQKIKVGHAGTLDPLATGLLVVLVGKETKNSNLYMSQVKEYETEILFGIKTETGDIDFENYKLQNPNYKQNFKFQVSNFKLAKILNSLKGKQKLKVPAYSAIKIKGKKLYELARKGKLEEKNLPEKEFEVFDIKLLDINKNIAKIRVNCSKGTYIRSIGEEIGKRLEIDSVIFNLRRTKSGKFNIKNAINLEEFLK